MGCWQPYDLQYATAVNQLKTQRRQSSARRTLQHLSENKSQTGSVHLRALIESANIWHSKGGLFLNTLIK